MTFRLTVAHGLASLAGVLADELADVQAGSGGDPFLREVVAVPGDGVRAWLTDRLAERLGSTGSGDGIVANVEFVFPATLVRRALGEEQAVRTWGVGPLTWAIHEAMHTDGELLGLPVDAVRARAIADLFDRYTLHRPAMVRRWEAGHDVDALGQQLAAHLRWQPQLWRLLVATLGESDAAAMALAPAELRTRRRTPQLPGRVFLVGLASLPTPHLAVLAALAEHTDVHVLAPTPSLTAWRRVRALAGEPMALPLARSVDPSVGVTAHRLGAGWGRAAREAHLLLANVALESGATVVEVDDRVHDPVDLTATVPRSALAELQHQIRLDLEPPGVPAPDAIDHRVLLAPGDRTIQWHRCHGLSRQVEVLRDVVLQLLDERDAEGHPRFHPRDITVLCPDPLAAAPLVEAAFAGSERDGVPAVPVRVADRSLRLDNALLDSVAALLSMLDGRFRASDVLAFAARAPVRRRFGLGADHLGRLAEWAEATNVHWGLDPAGRAAFGVPAEVTAHTWQASLDQLVVGSMMSDAGPRRGPGGVVPHADVAGDDLDLLGSLGDYLASLGELHAALTRPAPVATWCDLVADAAHRVCALADAESWQWRTLDRVLADLAAEATTPEGGARHRPVPAGELATLLTARLTGSPSRVRFRTGSVTVSSLTAQRAVPSPVVCLLGLDGDLAASAVGADDLSVTPPCIGDRDPRSELRAQLLDAVLAAGERFVVCSTGRDLRTNARVAPSVPLAELVDLLDATFVGPSRPAGGRVRASEAVAIDHPRQAWSERNFLVGDLLPGRPWSVDRRARDAAAARRSQQGRLPFLAAPLDAGAPLEVSVAELETTLKNPVRTLVQRRLGVSLPRDAAQVGDTVPLALDPLERWALKDELLRTMLSGAGWDDAVAAEWADVQVASGSVPPLEFGAAALETAVSEAAEIFRAFAELATGPASTQMVRLDGDGWLVEGEVAGIRGSLVGEVTASKVRPHHRLIAWLRVALLTLSSPDRAWEAVIVGRGDAAPAVVHVRLRSADYAPEVVAFVLDLHRRALRSVLPALPDVTDALARGDVDGAADEWVKKFGARDDRWVAVPLESAEFADVLAEPPLPDEHDAALWGTDPSGLRRWATRCWSMFERTAIEPTDDGEAGGRG
jgi:exodeoxyribonuclease V gamma subunit